MIQVLQIVKDLVSPARRRTDAAKKGKSSTGMYSVFRVIYCKSEIFWSLVVVKLSVYLILKNVLCCGMYSCHNLALSYIKPNYYHFATAAFPKRIPMTFIMLKMEFMSAFVTAAAVLKIFSVVKVFFLSR